MSTIAILGTLDTKGIEHGYLADLIRARGHAVLIIDVGTLEAPKLAADISREEVAAAGGARAAQLAERRDRGEAVAAMTRGAPRVLAGLAQNGRIQGVISLGGGGGTAIATAAMRALPIGFPKVMVSTLASGNVAPYVDVKDIVMVPSVVDIAGLNRISRVLLARAAGAVCGMVEATVPAASERPIIVASQFGNTTPCIERAKPQLEAAHYEVIVFAATGTGGRTMESLVDSGMVAGVLDITTTEWADELVGGVLTAGPTRLDAAALRGVPAVVSTGCLDMVNFGPPSTVPTKFQGRKFYAHNPQVTLMRTSVEESARLGEILAAKVNQSVGPVAVVLPLQGLSLIGSPGGPFHDPAADAALHESLRRKLRPDIPVHAVEAPVNAPEFADLSVKVLLETIRNRSTSRP